MRFRDEKPALGVESRVNAVTGFSPRCYSHAMHRLSHSLRLGFCVVALATLFGEATRPLAAQSANRAADSAGRAVIQGMHDAYDGAWYHSLTFVQRTTTWDSVRTPMIQTWYESLAQLDGRVVLRIDRGSPADGNGVLYTADSVWVMRGGKLAAARASGNVFLPLIEGVYVQPVDQTIRELRSTGVDFSRLHKSSWQGRPAIVIGTTSASDTTSPQIWVDTDRNVLMRMILVVVPGRPSMDIHMDGYERVGKGWLATKVSMFTGGVAQQMEEYSGWRVDMPLAASLFSPDQWTTTPHWAKP